jgi:hypothetical protein
VCTDQRRGGEGCTRGRARRSGGPAPRAQASDAVRGPLSGGRDASPVIPRPLCCGGATKEDHLGPLVRLLSFSTRTSWKIQQGAILNFEPTA